MKANITNLKKALKACAKAHKCNFYDWSEEGQLGVKSLTPATICDVHMILDAFYGNHDAAECGYECITIWMDESMNSKKDVDELTLALALPYGTKL